MDKDFVFFLKGDFIRDGMVELLNLKIRRCSYNILSEGYCPLGRNAV
jgi:hypothetical protein